MPEKKKKQTFVRMTALVPPCVRDHIMHEAYEYHRKHGGRFGDFSVVLCDWSASKDQQVKKELTDAGILPG